MRLLLLCAASLAPLAIAAACHAAPATAQPAPAPPQSTAMTMVGDHPRVTVRIEGVDRPLSFVVDSAAGASVVDAALAERLDVIDATRTLPPVQGAGGRVTAPRVTRLLSLASDDVQWRAQLLAMDLSHIADAGAPPIDGILGNDLMSRFDTRFDLPAGRLTLAPAGTLPRTGCIDNALPERGPALRRFAFVPAGLGVGTRTAEAVAVVDTGAAQTVLNRPAARALGLSDDDPRLRLRASGTRGLSKDAVETWLYDGPELTVDGHALPVKDVRISALPVFATLGLDTTPALILGVDALRDRPVDVLAGSEAVCLRPPAAAED